MPDDATLRDDAAQGDAAVLVRVAQERGLTIAVAESLTAGAVSARIADVPGASLVLTGGVVAYATRLKHELLGVDADLLATHGPVHPQVARQMAHGVRRMLGTHLGAATTGVAGPGPADGHPAGTVHIAVAWGPGDDEVLHRELRLTGERADVRAGTVDATIALLLEVSENADEPGREHREPDSR